jgi:hypothetical protein
MFRLVKIWAIGTGIPSSRARVLASDRRGAMDHLELSISQMSIYHIPWECTTTLGEGAFDLYPEFFP